MLTGGDVSEAAFMGGDSDVLTLRGTLHGGDVSEAALTGGDGRRRRPYGGRRDGGGAYGWRRQRGYRGRQRRCDSL